MEVVYSFNIFAYYSGWLLFFGPGHLFGKFCLLNFWEFARIALHLLMPAAKKNSFTRYERPESPDLNHKIHWNFFSGPSLKRQNNYSSKKTIIVNASLKSWFYLTLSFKRWSVSEGIKGPSGRIWTSKNNQRKITNIYQERFR